MNNLDYLMRLHRTELPLPSSIDSRKGLISRHIEYDADVRTVSGHYAGKIIGVNGGGFSLSADGNTFPIRYQEVKTFGILGP